MKRARLTLVLALAVLLTACGQNPTTTNTTTPNDGTTSQAPATPSTPAPSTPATPAVADRPGEIPEDALVVGAALGLTQLGQPGGKVVRPTFNGPKTLNSLTNQETSSSDVTRALYSGLVELNPVNFEVVPALAKSWAYSEDNRTVTFHLRRGVKFSDGTPFTADDVVFTFNDLIFNPDVNTDIRDNLRVQGQNVLVEKVDDHTVAMTTPEPFRPLLYVLALTKASIYPKHATTHKVAKLNPGVRGVMRMARQTLESNAEALTAAAAEAADLLDKGLLKLEEIIGNQNAELLTPAVMGLQLALGQLMEAVPDQATLLAALERASDEVGKIAGYAAEGLWEGVPPGTFNNSFTIDAPASEFIGAGPFTFVRYDVDQQVVFQRNPHYWKVDQNGVQLPYLEQLVYLIVENQDVSLLKFKTGEADVIDARPEDWSLLLEGLNPANDCAQRDPVTILCTDATNQRELLRGGPLFGTTYIVFNQDQEDPVLRAVFRSKEFRKAVAYALDKQSMIDNVYSGLGLAQWSPVSLPSPFFDDSESFLIYPHDLEKSGQLLDEIGLVDTDGDGVRNVTDRFLSENGVDPASLGQDENARELEFSFNTNSGNTLRERISALATTDLKKVGINPAYKPQDFNALVTELLGGKYEMVLIGFTGGVEPSSQSNIWTTPGGLHFWRFSAKTDPPEWERRVDELFHLAATTLDDVKVKEYFKEFQQLVSDHLPLIYTINQQYVHGAHLQLANTGHFQPMDGNTAASILFADVLWWEDPARRAEIEVVSPQG